MAKFCSNLGGWLRSIRLLALLVLLLPLARAAQATTIDIMLVYDNTASTWVASNGGMTAFSQDVVTRMNQAMQNSGIDATFRLVHSMQVNYNHASLDNDLDALEFGSGAFAAVDSARDTYGADLVAMLVDTGSAYGWVGLGYMLSNWSGSPSWGLTTNSIQSVATSHTLTHEVGHNLGADHSKYQTADPGPNDYLDGQYSAGWYFTGTDGVAYNTIMAYNDDGYGNHYTEAPLFSNPLKTYQGTAAGDASNGDNARLIEQTKDIIAAYRTAAVDPDPVGPDPLPDLIATSVTSSATGIPGGDIQVTATAGNQGNATAGSSWLGYYLSTDSTVTLSDIDTGWGCSVPEIAVGEYPETCSGSITLLNDIAPGTYYFGAYVDMGEEVTESDETNNGTAASYTITISNDIGPDLPDLVISSVTSPSTGIAGAQIDVGVIVKNQGDGMAGANWVSYYLSTDSTITLSDTETWSCAVGELSVGESVNGCAGSFPLPPNIAPGTYYLGAYADKNEEVTESDETNNGRAAAKPIVIFAGGDPEQVNHYLDASGETIIIDSHPNVIDRYLDYGGTDSYTFNLIEANCGGIWLIDRQASTIQLPAGLNISAAAFASDGAEFTINGCVVRMLGAPQLFTFDFAGAVERDFEDTADLFGASIPAQGVAPATGLIFGTIQPDGRLSD